MYTRRNGWARYPRCRSSCTAVTFCAGVLQSCPSIPGVLLPWFSVTRFTARARPLKEWVSRCCRACTRCHRPSSLAFTMRAWRRLTLRRHRFQSIWSQFTRSWEVAPRTGRPAALRLSTSVLVICVSSFVALPDCLVMGDHAEVCPLSRWGTRPLSAPLQSGLRFLRDPIPAAPWARLTARFPHQSGEDDGLTTFCTRNTMG
jgi:hypothetical protein